MPQAASGSFWGLFQQVLFGVDSPAGQFVVYLILALFVIGIIDLLLAVARTYLNYRGLAVAEATFRTREAADPLPAEPEGLLRALGFEGLALRSAVAKRIAYIGRRAANPDLDPAHVREMTESQMEQSGSIARFLAGTLTVVGLIGTVIGLSLAVHQLPELVNRIESTDSLQVFSQRMLQTLAGMGTAFSCTLAGLSSAVILSMLCYVLRYFQMGFSGRLDVFTYEMLLPSLVAPKADQAARGFGKLLESTGRRLDKAIERVEVAAAAMDAGAERFRAAVEALGGHTASLSQAAQALGTSVAAADGLRELPSLIRQAVADGMQDAVGRLSQSWTTTLEGRLRDISQEFSQAHREQQEAYADLFLAVGEDVRLMTDRFTTPISELAMTQREVGDALRHFSSAVRDRGISFQPGRGGDGSGRGSWTGSATTGPTGPAVDGVGTGLGQLTPQRTTSTEPTHDQGGGGILGWFLGRKGKKNGRP